jgi:predicted ATPase
LKILEYCDSSIVRNRENYYIKRFNPEYNNLNNAGSGYKHTEENEGSKGVRENRHSNITKAKISESAFARKEKKLYQIIIVPCTKK